MRWMCPALENINMLFVRLVFPVKEKTARLPGRVLQASLSHNNMGLSLASSLSIRSTQ